MDSSRSFRNIIDRCLAGQADIKVIGSLNNGEKALEFLMRQKPDLVTLDVEMPVMDGIQTLRVIQIINRERPEHERIGCIMVSASTKRGASITLKCLENGAFDFITKPGGDSSSAEENFQELKNQLLPKIRAYAQKYVFPKKPRSLIEEGEKKLLTREVGQEKIKVLIVDDSRIFRNIVEKTISQHPDIQVIGSVWNGVKALEFIMKERPHVVSLDLEMPEMDGLETLRVIQIINRTQSDQIPIGIIMVSAYTSKGAEVTLECLEGGAFDFVPKVEQNKSREENFAHLKEQLLPKILAYAKKHVYRERRFQRVVGLPRIIPVRPGGLRVRALFIGVSTGGPKALMTLMPQLSVILKMPIFIVQHMPPNFTESLANSLDGVCSGHKVIEAPHMKEVVNDCIYIAPGGVHLKVQKGAGSRIVTAHGHGPRDSGCKPSVNELFKSGVKVYGSGMLAIILTGMGRDGSDSLPLLKKRGVRVLVQDEESSVVWGMPGSALSTGLVDEVLPLDKIPERLKALIGNTIK
ncbi:chemotaxis-specific protein-glutamate methyltransferase CheB [Candidatus Riflebacteria bacterium]